MYGDTKVVIEPTKEKFRSELYMTADPATLDDTHEPELTFTGRMEYRLAVRIASKALGGSDSALQSLKSNMEQISREKANSKYTPEIIDHARATALMRTTQKRIAMEVDPLRLQAEDKRKRMMQQSNGKTGRGNVFGSRMVAPNSSNAPSPALSAASPKPNAPTSAPGPSSLSIVQKAIRVPLLHLLAVKPAKLQDIVRKIRAPKNDILVVLGKIGKELGGEWKLSDKSFKELDVFKFPYPSDEIRKHAIDNATRALDRQRLDPKDKIWQKLLPEEERGKGKVVSKLSLGAAAAVQKAATPTVKPTQRLKSLTKKVEPKKTEPRKRKAEEDPFDTAPRKRAVKPHTADVRDGPAQKKTAKRPADEEKEAVLERKKLSKVTSDEDKERVTLTKTAKRPNVDDKQGEKKRLKRPGQDDREGALQKKKVPKPSTDSENQEQQKTTRIPKEEVSKAGTAGVPSKDSKQESTKPEQKASNKLPSKKQQQSAVANKPSTTESSAMVSKKVARPERKIEQKVSDQNAKNIQPKITEKPFHATKKLSDRSKNTSIGSPATTSDVEKRRTPYKASPSSLTATGVNTTPGNSDRTLKRKANDIDSDIHTTHDTNAKQRKTAHSTPVSNITTAASTPLRSEKSTLKRKAQTLDSDAKQPAAKKLAASLKVPKPTQTPTPSYSGASSISSTSSLHSQHQSAGPTRHHDSPQSLHDSSSASPEHLTIRQTVDLSARFKSYYAKYHTLHTSLSRREEPPTDAERLQLHKMHETLVKLKKDIHDGVSNSMR